ncbi:Uracil-DNA glycosylase-like protein [Rhodopirellula maiorica SM1]|uniref:Uracil-DNA glycosylase-like protein n=1 Tax=Rhodopirellula maiorica SM1 TaxID=1265738 RepID=M5RTH7_9BACT|nr:uracil-DNA glycosylase family protein [Rhodopirellula maiorica]EMI18687.1 Uracil-DNA glycosylase-like protein [Rhodopirellula maiorica SM1]
MAKKKTSIRDSVIAAAKQLRDDVDSLSFSEPVTHVYNPLRYAWNGHQAYLQNVNNKGVKVVFLGMNPGPWGMAQTGVPFGEIDAVKNWMGINVPVDHPENEHPKRPVEGFDCAKSEVSGRRLWGLFRERFKSADRFFKDHFVLNYCPLVFMEESARNRTPDKLPVAERATLNQVCDAHLQKLLQLLNPAYVVGVGAYAEGCLKRTLDSIDSNAKLSRILHPSPASPAANRDWAGTATKQLKEAGIWK